MRLLTKMNKQVTLFGERFEYFSNFQHCLDNDCEDSKYYIGNVDLLRITFSDNLRVNLFADVNQEEDIEQKFSNPEAVIIPFGSKLSQSQLKVVSHLMIDNSFHKQLRRAFYALLKWHI